MRRGLERLGFGRASWGFGSCPRNVALVGPPASMSPWRRISSIAIGGCFWTGGLETADFIGFVLDLFGRFQRLQIIGLLLRSPLNTPFGTLSGTHDYGGTRNLREEAVGSAVDGVVTKTASIVLG